MSLRVLFLLLLFSCAKKEPINYTSQAILQTIDSAIDSITFNSLDSVVLIHFEFYPENAKRISIQKYIERKDNDSSILEIKLMKKLAQKSIDSVSFVFKNPFKFKENVIVEEMTRDKVKYPNNEIFGRISLIDPEFTSDGKFGCYYLALDCQQIALDCSVGYVIFIRKNNSDWSVSDVRQIWQGGRPMDKDAL